MRPHRLPRSTLAVLPPSLKAARCRRYPRRGVSERRTTPSRDARTCTMRTSARTPRGTGRARRAARHARRAGAQDTQQLELRQRGGDRAVQLVFVEIPAKSMICAAYWKGTCWVLTENEHARWYCERYRIPHGAGPLQGGAASVRTAACGEGTRTAVRRCVRAHAGVLTDTNGQALARRRTARHRARGGRTGQSAY